MIDLVAWLFWIAIAVALLALVIRTATKTKCAECTSWIPKDARRCPKCTAEV